MKRQTVVQGTLCATVPIRVTVGLTQYVSCCGLLARREADALLDIDQRDLLVHPGGRLGMLLCSLTDIGPC